MKLNLSREDLLEPLQKVIGIVDRKQTIAILGNVLIQADNNVLTLTTTDTEIELIAKRELKTPQTAELTLPALKLYDICKNLNDAASISLEDIGNNKVVLSSERSKFTLLSLPVNNFPVHNELKVSSSFTLLKSELKQVLIKTVFCMAQQDVRFYLNGILLETEANILRTVATDGHRLAVSEINTINNLGEARRVIIPSKGIKELQKLLDDSDTPIIISLDNRFIRVDMQNFIFIAQFIDASFPEYQKVIPVGCNKKITLNKAAFKQALVRTAILSSDKLKGVRIKAVDNLLTINSRNSEKEEAEETIEVDYSSELIEISFNINYMLDVLAILDNETLQLEIKDGANSCFIQENDGKSRYVIMPMRI